MLAVSCFAACREPHAVAHGQGKLLWPVGFEAVGKRDRRLDPIGHHEAISFRVAGRVLLKLNQVARIVLRRIPLLRVRQMRRNPCLYHAFVGQVALRLQPAADGTGDAPASACVGDTTRAVLSFPSFVFSAAADR